jgi:hypothetical protein
MRTQKERTQIHEEGLWKIMNGTSLITNTLCYRNFNTFNYFFMTVHPKARSLGSHFYNLFLLFLLYNLLPLNIQSHQHKHMQMVVQLIAVYNTTKILIDVVL